MSRLLNRLCTLAEFGAVLLLIAVTALITTQIIAREIFVAGAPWADELARWCGLGLVFLASAPLLLRAEHVRVDIVLRLLPARLAAHLELINALLTALFCGLYLVSGWYFLQRAGRFSTPALGLPNLMFYASAAIGMALMLCAALDRLRLAFQLAGRSNTLKGQQP